MTCFIASADPSFVKQLSCLCDLANETVVSGRADVLLLDLDAPIPAPACVETIRFSKSTKVYADFYRPFSYRAFLDELALCARNLANEQHTFAYEFPEETIFTATEKRLLDALIQADGKTISAGQLALLVFGNEECLNELKVYIRHLRQKIEEPQGVRVIETVRGEGYRLRKDRVVRQRRCIDNQENK